MVQVLIIHPIVTYTDFREGCIISRLKAGGYVSAELNKRWIVCL